MVIIVDDREPELIKKLKKKYDDKDIEVKRLNVADVNIVDSNDNLRIIIERKTIDDYISSRVIDGRLAQQVDNMLGIKNETPNIIMVFIIESWESFEGKKHGMTFKTFETSVNHLFLRGFNIVKTANIAGTAKWISKMYNEINECQFGGSIKKKDSEFKKSGISKKKLFTNQLASIPGISRVVARNIRKKYKSWQELIDAFINDNGIEGIECGTNKKISKTRSEQVKHILRIK